MKKILLLWLSLMIVFLIAQPAHSHELKIDEPDHPLQWIGVVFYPVGHLMHHLIFGRGHADVSSSALKAEQQAAPPPHTPKYNFSPRKKVVPAESMDTQAVPEQEQKERMVQQPQESEDIYVPPETE